LVTHGKEVGKSRKWVPLKGIVEKHVRNGVEKMKRAQGRGRASPDLEKKVGGSVSGTGGYFVLTCATRKETPPADRKKKNTENGKRGKKN